MSSFSLATIVAGPTKYGPSTGSWQPLPTILNGVAIYPYNPSAPSPFTPTTPKGPTTPTRPTHKNRFSWSGHGANLPKGKEVGGKSNPYEIPVEIGDEFFAFEEYRCTLEEDGRGNLWYRGYVVQSVSLHDLSPPYATSSSIKPEPSVLIGIFPAGIVHIRPTEGNDDEGLTAAYEKAVRLAEERARNVARRDMDAVAEEDEGEGDHELSTPGGQIVDTAKRKPALAQSGPRGRPKSLAWTPGEPDEEKDQPPLPKLTAGDSTVAGGLVPLVDEIACAIREWYSKLPMYLANREYRLFGTVVQHIDALLLGRRQLLSQTLSADELIRVRRECVSRLVKCNVAQGLEVIVRSLDDGSVLVVEQARAFSGASWIGGIKAYVFQVQLAYIDMVPLDTLFGKHSMISPKHPKPPVPRPFSILDAPAGAADTQSYYHLLLDIRAFIASPCASGETMELYFSLFNKAENRFLTEEFCLVLNHLGTPARDAEQRLGRLRTLFINLKQEDVSGSICLICRMVRNGALRMRADAQGTLDGHRRAPSMRNGSLALGSELGRSTLTIREDATDDSFSVTSGFGVVRTATRDTAITASAGSLLDGRSSYRRPLGCAVLELPQLARLTGEGDKLGSEYSVPIYMPRGEETFATLHEDILHHRTKEFVSSPKAEAIALSLRLVKGVASQLARETPGLLLDVPFTSRLGFPDVVLPSTVRNDLYVKLWSATFYPVPTSSGGSIRNTIRRSSTATNQGNVQVTLEVRRPDGTIIPDALYAGGAGEPPISQYHSMVFINTDKPTFGELVKVSLPRNTEAHLYLSFRSRGKDKYYTGDRDTELERPFAFAYLPLFTSPGVIKDGAHELVLYRMDKSLPSSPSVYLQVPSVSSAPIPQLKNLTVLRDRLTVRSYLASTVHSQDETLQSLFGWHALSSQPDALASTLQRFGFVNEEEIAKFVPAVLDALIAILTASLGSRQDEINQLVFKSLVKVLAMSSDRRFGNFDDVLDIYLSQYFKSSAASAQLLKSMKGVMSDPSSPDYRAFLKVWHLSFRFIVRGRELDRARGVGLDATSAHLEADFKTNVRSLLGDINVLMSSSDKSLIGTQALAVQHYADVLPSLSAVFGPVEIAEIVIAFADTLTHARGSIAIYKLLLLLQMVEHVFDSAESRALLIPALVRWIKPHLGRYDDVAATLGGEREKQALKDGRRIKWMECARLAITVVARTVDKLQDWLVSPVIQEDEALRTQEEDSIEYCLTLLPSLCSTYADFSRGASADAIQRHRGTSSIWKETPDVFPMAHPFALVAQLPPPSLLERHHHAGEDGLPTVGTFNTGLAEAAVVINSLILACPRPNLLRFLLEVLDIEGVQITSDTLSALMDTAASVLRFEAFPATWLTLSLMCFSATIKLLDVTAEVLDREVFIPPLQSNEPFDEALWNKCFCLLCDLCGSDELALEEQTQQRRRAGWIIAGDLRDEGASLFLRLWNAIGWPIESGGNMRYGGYQTRFTSLADQVLALCLSSHDRMCEISVEILFSMIYAEYLRKGNFEAIETEIFAKLETIFSPKANPKAATADPAMRAYFIAQLRSVFESTPAIDENFHRRVSTFLEEVELFIDLLLALSELPNTPAWKDERAMATYRLTIFIKRVGRMDLYIRFVHSLVAIYVESKDWLGAGLAIRLHAEVYPWSLGDTLVEAFEEGDIRLPVQTPFARRESLYYHAIDYFAEAEAYEFALDLCQELVLEHQRQTYNIEKLSELLTHQARLWERIGGSSRPKPEYFRVAFYGAGTPINRNKDFIVRGQPWERYADFCESLAAKYPNATIHRSKIPPELDEEAPEEQVIWATSVSPDQDSEHPALREAVPHSIQAYHRHNGLSTFSSSRPYMPDGEPARDKVLTWIEKTILTTADTSPGILSRSEVVDITYLQISPLTTATTEIVKATEALRELTTGKGGAIDAKQLGTAINGAVDSPVSGGVRVYRKAFLDPSYVAKHPSDEAAVTELRDCMLDYVRAIREALTVHKAICQDIAFHEALKNQFHRTFPDEIAQLPRPSNSTAASTPGLNGHEFDYLAVAPSPIAKDSPRISFSSEAGSPRVLQISSMAQPVPPKARYEGSAPTTATGSSFILPPLRLGPSPVDGRSNGTAALSSPKAATITRSETVKSPINGVARALSVIGSSVSAKSGSGSRRSASPVPSMGSRTTTGDHSIPDSTRLDPSSAGETATATAGKKEGSRLKRLSALVKGSRSNLNLPDAA